jgi:endonuclease YncB( thermonuclease family)
MSERYSYVPPLILTVFFLALALTACAPRHSLYFDAAERSSVAAPASSQVRVIQADALVVEGRRVHMVDAVTPQPAPDAACPAEALAARQARLRLAALAGEARHVEVRLVPGVDRYNRANAHLSFDGHDPASVLIDEGLAVAPTQQAFSWCGSLSGGYPRAQHLAMLSLAGS